MRKASWQRDRVRHSHTPSKSRGWGFRGSETWSSADIRSHLHSPGSCPGDPTFNQRSLPYKDLLPSLSGYRASTKPFSSRPGQYQPARGCCSLSFRVRALLPGRVRDLPVPAQETAPPSLPAHLTFPSKPMLPLRPVATVVLQGLVEQLHMLPGSQPPGPRQEKAL